MRTKRYTAWQIIPYIYDALAEELAAYDYDGETSLLVQLKFRPMPFQERGHLKVITERWVS